MTPDEERRLLADVADLHAHVAALAQEVADISAVGNPVESAPHGRQMFATLDAWVSSYFIPVFRRPLGGEYRWCAQWADHAEARERLEALWTSWEALRDEKPTGMVTWLTSLLDPQLPILLGRSGPFASCTPSRHDPERSW